ncbi:MAG: cyclase family protein [Proteobacteria bacterium]|nr:cyclase family protein [Pseudomonadota bacterium]
MRVLDISRRISPRSVVLPGDAPLSVEPICDVAPGCPCRITALTGWTTHFLTHVDAPRHFFSDGATLDAIELDRFVCEALVVELAEGDDFVDVRHVQNLPDLENTAVLFRSRNSRISTDAPFHEGHVYLSGPAAKLLIRKHANLVGVDYLSVDRFGDEEFPAHRALLGNNVLVLEGLNLSSVRAGRYRLSALPLKIQDADGSPVRAVLV